MSVPNGAYTRTQSFLPEQDRIVPRFFIESIPDEVASARENRPIFKDQERVELLMPGNMNTIPVHIVTNEHRERWPQQYQAFRAGQDMAVEGTPLEQWPILRRSQVLELKALNFFTVENIRDMNDHACQKMMGGMRLRELARAYMDDAEAGKLLSQITYDNEKKDAEIADLRRRLDEQSALLMQVHGDLQNLRNAPNPIHTVIPGSFDPIEQAKSTEAYSSAGSSLASLPEPRRRGPGRPPKNPQAIA